MGTNFYYKIPLKQRQVKELRESITADMDLTIFHELYENMTKGHIVHLGKRSAGWQFLWDYNDGEYYKANLQSIREFLEKGEGYIENEYYERFTVNGFFEDIKDWLYKDEDHCDMISYHEKYPDEPFYVNPADHEFQSDNLRFSKHTEFS